MSPTHTMGCSDFEEHAIQQSYSQSKLQKFCWYYLELTSFELHIFEGHCTDTHKHLLTVSIGSSNVAGIETKVRKSSGEFRFFLKCPRDVKYEFKVMQEAVRDEWVATLQKVINSPNYRHESVISTDSGIVTSARHLPFNYRHESVISTDSGIETSTGAEVQHLPLDKSRSYSEPPVKGAAFGSRKSDEIANYDCNAGREHLQARTTVSSKWFWGSMNRVECEDQLREKGQLGNFVVRVNTNKDYIMSLWREDGISHHRIIHEEDMWRFEKSAVSAEGQNLEDLLDVYMKNCTDKNIKPFGGALFEYTYPWMPSELDVRPLGVKCWEKEEARELSMEVNPTVNDIDEKTESKDIAPDLFQQSQSSTLDRSTRIPKFTKAHVRSLSDSSDLLSMPKAKQSGAADVVSAHSHDTDLELKQGKLLCTCIAQTEQDGAYQKTSQSYSAEGGGRKRITNSSLKEKSQYDLHFFRQKQKEVDSKSEPIYEDIKTESTEFGIPDSNSVSVKMLSTVISKTPRTGSSKSECHDIQKQPSLEGPKSDKTSPTTTMTPAEASQGCYQSFKEPSLQPKPEHPANYIDYTKMTFSYEGGICKLENCTLSIPKGSIPPMKVITIEMGVMLYTQPVSILPRHMKPVSPIIELCVVNEPSFKFTKPVTIQILHSLDISSDDDVKKMGLHFLKSHHNLYNFRTTDGKEKFPAKMDRGILTIDHFCSFCIVADDSIKASRFYYYIMSVLPKEITSSEWNIVYCIVPITCIKAVEKQYSSSEYKFTKIDMFKFNNDTLADPFVEVHFERELTGGWHFALLRGTKIRASAADYTKFEREVLECQEKEKLYPPRFTIEVSGVTACRTATLVLKFMGSVENFTTEVVLKPYTKAVEGQATSPRSGNKDRLSSDLKLNLAPTHHDLLNHIAVKIPTKWRYIGVQLRLKVADLDAIEKSCCSDYTNCFSKVFDLWEKQLTPPTCGLPSLRHSPLPCSESID